jgi:hypothetical protein
MLDIFGQPVDFGNPTRNCVDIRNELLQRNITSDYNAIYIALYSTIDLFLVSALNHTDVTTRTIVQELDTSWGLHATRFLDASNISFINRNLIMQLTLSYSDISANQALQIISCMPQEFHLL